MNKVIMIGRLTRDPDIRYTQGQDQMCIARFTLAVDRKGRRQEGQQNADFPSCVAFGKAGEFIEKWIKKGTKIAVTGRLQTGSYTNRDGIKVYTTDVVCEDVEFAESKAAGSARQNGGNGQAQSGAYTPTPAEGDAGYDGFMNIPDGIDEELPFS